MSEDERKIRKREVKSEQKIAKDKAVKSDSESKICQ